MPKDFFLNRLAGGDLLERAVLDITSGGKVLIISDFHMGSGSRDDLNQNGEMIICLLEEYYFKNGWTLVLNGDIEELQKFSLTLIQERWAALFRVFNLFNEENRLYKLIGNHDEQLLLKRYNSYPYRLYNFLKIDTGIVPAYVYHGHQLSGVYSNYNRQIGAAVHYILKPFGIKNISAARNPNKRFAIEKKAYSFSLQNRCLSIIGHTHRPLFESLGRFDFIKFEIERLCRDYTTSSGEEQIRIEKEIFTLRGEMGKLKRKEKSGKHMSLYGDDLPVPCLFNSGCAIGKNGINAIELSNKDIALIYWFTEGKESKFVTRGSYDICKIPETSYSRAVLNQSNLDYIFAKIKLLGSELLIQHEVESS